ncbi:TPR repeat-containing protein [Haliscomenobacter hydrossis DSM 1100]|uniref:TPR repeat-containing protein n=1 Tax=Haliscomenobacter hydrossis (strain ATCC 27775 / DSM 1100 / LMG 10767 / O) TaxID=760192 RepID=F4L4W3_HALH1|nr:TPR repeat-containing protein [Haliscomenobacter hydrossis DSM 1100]
MAISYQFLGNTHSNLGNLQQALAFFEQFNELEKELYADFPQNVVFKNGLAVSYERLGQTHRDLGNLPQALTFFEDETKLFEELYADYPQNVSFKNSLALSYQWLGWFHEEKLQNQEKAQECYRASQALLIELVESFPAYVEFKKNLEWVNERLGSGAA